MSTVIALALVIAAAGLALYKYVKNLRSGSPCCGSSDSSVGSSGCAGCSGCGKPLQ